jgi:hypothetical protein
MKKLVAILAMLVAGCDCAYAETFSVTDNATFAAAVVNSKTSAPPHVITLMPGTYTNLYCAGMTGTVRSVSGSKYGPSSAQDTIVDSNFVNGQNGINVGATIVTIMGLQVRNTKAGNGILSSTIGTIQNCIFDNIQKAVGGAAASSYLSAYGCTFTRCSGVSVINSASAEIYNNLFVACTGDNIYGGIIYQEGGAGKIVGNTIVQCNVTSSTNVALITQESSGGVTLIQNNVAEGTNRMFKGNYVDAGGNVSNAVGNLLFFSIGSGYGTNATVGNYRLIPNSAAWRSGVQTSVVYKAAASNYAYDVAGANYRGITNNSSGAYFMQSHVMALPQFQGVFTP